MHASPVSPIFFDIQGCSIKFMLSWMRHHLWHIHSPCRFNLAPEAEGFIYVEFSLSCQGSENVLLQPDGLSSVPAVGWLLSARNRSSVAQSYKSHFLKYCAQSLRLELNSRQNRHKLPSTERNFIFQVSAETVYFLNFGKNEVTSFPEFIT